MRSRLPVPELTNIDISATPAPRAGFFPFASRLALPPVAGLMFAAACWGIGTVVSKQAVAEIARVLKPGGRVGVSDIVADDLLTLEQRAERGSYVGCIAGALSFREFRAGLREVGLTHVEVVPTHQVAEGMHSAIVRATKPA